MTRSISNKNDRASELNSISNYLARSSLKIRNLRLRNHQEESVTFMQDRKGPRRVLRQGPTGSGKSTEIRASSYLDILDGHDVVIATPSKEVVDRFVMEYMREQIGLRPYVDIAQTKAPKGARLTITTHQTFWRRVEDGKYSTKTKIYFDEGHHDNALAIRNRQALTAFDSVAEYSATPWSPFCLSTFEEKCIYKLENAIQDGYVKRPKIEPETLYDIPLNELYIPSEKDPEKWQRTTDNEAKNLRREIWFYNALTVARQVLRLHPKGTGYVCGIEEQCVPVNAVTEFLVGRLHRLLAVGRLKEGFDAIVHAVAINKKVNSPIQAMQMAGRALRVFPGSGIIRIVTESLPAIDEAFELANGAPVVCRTCGSHTHLTVHHNSSESIDEE